MSKVLKLFMLGSLFVVEIATAKPCENLPSYENFKQALIEARKEGNGGLNLDMWGTLLDRSGEVCAVAYTGSTVDAQWLGSRVISAQKANTANAFSLKGLALSTANLYSAVQPGG
ncbi:MAG: GlcG/HbpS family heme-binding protein, partial [Bdellovibrio sp.]